MILEPKKRIRKDRELVKTKTRIKETHLHEYVRSSASKDIYRCMDPDCTHYQSKKFLDGKRAKCFKCKESFIIPKSQLLNRIPVCLNCTKSKKAQSIKDVAEVLEDMFAVKEISNLDAGHLFSKE